MSKLRIAFVLVMSLMLIPVCAAEYAGSDPMQGGEFYVMNKGKGTWLGRGLLDGANAAPQLWEVTLVEGGYNVKQAGAEKYVSITDNLTETNLFGVKYTTTITASDDADVPSTLILAGTPSDGYSMAVPNLYKKVTVSSSKPSRDVTYYFGFNKTLGTKEAVTAVDDNSTWIFVSKSDYDLANAVDPKLESNLAPTLIQGDVIENAFTTDPAGVVPTFAPEGILAYDNGTVTAVAQGSTTITLAVAEGYYNGKYYHAGSRTFDVSVINLDVLKDAIADGKAKLAQLNQNRGFLAGMYAPASIAPLAKAIEDAETLLTNIGNDVSTYLNEEAINDAINAINNFTCTANEVEINAIANPAGELAQGEAVTMGGTGALAMPLQGNTLYKLTVDYTGGELGLNLKNDGKSILKVNTANQSLIEEENAAKHFEQMFFTTTQADYTLDVEALSDSVKYNITLFTAPTVGDEMKGTDLSQVEESTEVFVYNMATGLFLNNKNTCDGGMPTMWTLTRNAETNTWTITNNDKAVGVNLIIPSTSITIPIPILGDQTLGGYSSNVPDSVAVVSNAAEASQFTIQGTADGYTIANTTEWEYFNFADVNLSNIMNLISNGGFPASYTSYLYTGEPVDGASALLAGEYPSMYNARWKFVSREEYEQTVAYRNQVIEALKKTLAESQESIKGIQNSALRKGIANAMMAKAAVLNGIVQTPIVNQFIAPATSELVKAIDECEAAVEYAKVNSMYYVACKEGINNMSNLSSGVFVKGIVLAANTELELCLSTTAMDAAMLALRASATLYAQTVETWAMGQDFTGFVGNNSFSTGGIDKWLPLSAQQLAGLVPSIKDIMDKLPITAEPSATVVDGHLESNSAVMQAVVALPEGRYRLSAQMATSALNDASLYALIVDGGDLIDNIKDVASSLDLSFEDVFKLAEAIIKGGSITDIIKEVSGSINIDADALMKIVADAIQGNAKKVNVNAVKGEGADKFVENNLEFEIDSRSILLIGTSAQVSLASDIIPDGLFDGLTALLGTANYKADDVRLTYVRNLWDVNLDGSLDVVDVTDVLNVVLGVDDANKYEGRADVNKNNKIDVDDINVLINKVLRK
ncbi:MAG: dockerin type I repeat-containing protein [Bacteroidales bacterium]|nr:dockerin type I repeat-containing protein [Candidatus Sodaliphilus limicaballi]